MKKLLLVLLAIPLGSLWSQDTVGTIKDVKLDMLKTPSSAAFTVMGTTPTEIQQPSSAPEFVVAVQNASNSFSQFPNNFGFSVTPFWWTHGKTLSFDEDFSTENKLTGRGLYRNMRVSGGVVSGSDDNPDLWRYGFGVQTNILSGKVDSEKKEMYLQHLLRINKDMFERESRYYETFPKYVKINADIDSALMAGDVEKIEKLQAQRDSLEEALKGGLDKVSVTDSLEIWESFGQLDLRYGWKWDLGAAMSYDFQGNKLDSSNMHRSGVWSNFGYSFKPGSKAQWTVLGAVRYFYYDQVFYQTEASSVLLNKMGVLDAGARVILDAGKFSLSAEGLYRYGFEDVFESTYKLNAMVNYRFSENRMVYFSLGNDFNDTSVGGPEKLRVFVGLNLGLGEISDIKYKLR